MTCRQSALEFYPSESRRCDEDRMCGGLLYISLYLTYSLFSFLHIKWLKQLLGKTNVNKYAQRSLFSPLISYFTYYYFTYSLSLLSFLPHFHSRRRVESLLSICAHALLLLLLLFLFLLTSLWFLFSEILMKIFTWVVHKITSKCDNDKWVIIMFV